MTQIAIFATLYRYIFKISQREGSPMISRTQLFKDACKFGWNSLRNNFGILIGATLAHCAPLAFSALLVLSLQFLSPWPMLIVSLFAGFCTFAFMMFIDMGYIKIFLNIYDGKPVLFKTLFSMRSKTIRGTLTTLGYILIFFAALGLSAIPGFLVASFMNHHGYGFLALKLTGLAIGALTMIPFYYFIIIPFFYYLHLIVDGKTEKEYSFNQSRTITQGFVGFVLLLNVFEISFNQVISFPTFGLGIIVSYPFLAAVKVYIYRKLLEQSKTS